MATSVEYSVDPPVPDPKALRAPDTPARGQPVDDLDFRAPDFTGSLEVRIGSSVIEQFVSGHDASDILRELVQNEYDGGGHALSLTFGSDQLEVAGTGRDIRRGGWKRLSVIVGTGTVMGSHDAEFIKPKTNGIGSKNFGLRALFRFGDEIYVRSAGQVGVLNLRTQETGRKPDVEWKGEKGVRVNVPYRQKPFKRLDAFTVEREAHALDLMAEGMRDTLVKLAHTGKTRGIREVTVNSLRTGRSLLWRQTAKAEHCKVRGVDMVMRSGRLIDRYDLATTFQETEFSRAVDIPPEHVGREYPAYYRVSPKRLKIAVSLPFTRRRVDLAQRGHLFYPLKAPASRTGCTVSVSAPFELNNDRSEIIDDTWNDWLIDQAVELTIDLLKEDWLARYGADAYKSLIVDGVAGTSRFAKQLAQRLTSESCWPTCGKADARFAVASQVFIPAIVIPEGILDGKWFLDPVLSADDDLTKMILTAGAKTFSLSSLVRLRCAGKDRKALATELGEKEADIHYSNFERSLADIGRQVKLASGLSSYLRKLTKDHKADLRNTASTLSATGELRPACELLIVEDDLWEQCPEPRSNRLEPALAPHKAVSGHCPKFDEARWLIDAANRSVSAPDDDQEREALYRRLLTWDTPFSKPVFQALRGNPVVRNQRGQWVEPAAMVDLKKPLAQTLAPFVDAPSKQMLSARGLVARLRVRTTLNGSDLVRFASGLAELPELAERFERLLADNLRLLTPSIIDQLRALPCIRARSGILAPPTLLHLDTPANRMCIDDHDRIVAGPNEFLYRKLKVHAEPEVDTLLEIIERQRDASQPPPHAELLYPALVLALARGHKAKADLAHEPICWVRGDYHAPADILVGLRTSLALEEAIPVHRHLDAVGRAYADLGAPTAPTDEHWTRFFRHVSTEWAPVAPVDDRKRRILLDAYSSRGALGLPAGQNDLACLLDDRNRLFSLADLQWGKLVEPDFPNLQRALREANSKIGVIAQSERSRAFFGALKIRPLSSIAATGTPVLGEEGKPNFWYQPKHSERYLALFHLPIFAQALWEIAYRQRHGSLAFTPTDLTSVQASFTAMQEIAFFKSIGRRYSVAGVTVQVPTDIAVDDARIGMIPPRTMQEFQFRLADALAEIAGAKTAATVRDLAPALLPLLLCTRSDDLRAYLARIGIEGFGIAQSEDDQADALSDDLFDDPEELALRQVFDNLNTAGQPSDHEPVEPDPDAPDRTVLPPLPPPLPPPPPTFTLPELEEVDLTVTPLSGEEIAVRPPSRRGGSSYSGYSLPMTPEEQARARLVGQRGEQLVYRMELERVRAMGHANPEQFVVWTSQTDTYADHDIRSIDKEGKPRWIEVKSTTGVDGRFEWSRNEFERALRERERYELWRVYKVGDKAPIAKCFTNPARMIGSRRIALELGLLRANIEAMS